MSGIKKPEVGKWYKTKLSTTYFATIFLLQEIAQDGWRIGKGLVHYPFGDKGFDNAALASPTQMLFECTPEEIEQAKIIYILNECSL